MRVSPLSRSAELGRLPLRAVVLGSPLTYGSKRVFLNKQTGRPILVNADHKNLRTWQDAIRAAMAGAAAEAGLAEPIGGQGLLLEVRFYLRRPRSHFNAKGELLPSARAIPVPTRKPDGDKVFRAVADCGTGIWYADDAQVCDGIHRKRWAGDGLERTEVALYPFADPPDPKPEPAMQAALELA